jgi:SSS family solute:Na+ symporter
MLHLTLLLAYSVALIAIGVWIGRRVTSTSDFFVAGRRLSPVLLFATVLAANIGAGSTVGAAGLGYRDGLSAWWWVGSAGLGSLVLAFWVGPKIRALAAAHELQTVGDFLEWRYGRTVRAVVAVLLWFGTLAILAAQLVAVAFLLNAVIGVPKFVGCLIGGVVMTTYFVAGGLLASAGVNLVQLVVLLLGFAVALPLALEAVGGFRSLQAAAPATTYWNFWQGSGSGWIYLAMLGPSFVVSPGLLQKVYGARDDRAVRIGVGANAAVLLAFAFVPPLLGMIARVLHPDLPHRDLALPILLVQDLPLLVGSLGLAALFSAEVSSADAILFMLATSLSRDLYRRFVNPAASDRQVLSVARGAAIAGGVLGVALAIVLDTIVDALTIFYTVLTVSLFVPVVAGLYTRRPGRVEALAAIGTGVTLIAVLRLASAGAGWGWLTPATIGLAGAAAAFVVVFVARASSGDSFANRVGGRRDH